MCLVYLSRYFSDEQDSDAYSSSPQPAGRNRSHERSGLTGLRNIGNTVRFANDSHPDCNKSQSIKVITVFPV